MPLRSHDFEQTHSETLGQIVAELRLVQAALRARVEPRLLTMEQAAVYLGRTRRGIEHLISRNAFAVIRYGDRVHIDKVDLDAWIARNRF